MADLKGKVALVTVAGVPLGRGIAEGLAEAGCTVCLADAEDHLRGCEEALESVVALGGGGRVLCVDFEDPLAVAGLFASIYGQEGRLDLLVNNRLDPGGAAICAVPGLLEDAAGLLVDVLPPGGEPEPEGCAAGSSVTRLSVQRSETSSHRYTGRCLAALAMDPDIRDKHLGAYGIAELAAEYRFSELAAEHQK